MDDDLMEFVVEVRAGFAAIADDIVLWREQPDHPVAHAGLLRYVRNIKSGSGFVHMARIEALASAAETALQDIRHWGLDKNAPHIGLVMQALARIEAIAVAVELGVACGSEGEEQLVHDLSGQAPAAHHSKADTRSVLPTVARLPLRQIYALRDEAQKLAGYVNSLHDQPAPGQLAI
ncbi:MAG: hypothetical protein KGJ05_03315, partial [Alphaproteobacteria bacterium]|nr:hypothetical protein [Alphaproteobacteria bacterium]